MPTADSNGGYVKVPINRFVGMLVFLASLIVAILADGGQGAPFGLTWSSFYVGWLAYLVLLVTSFMWRDKTGGDNR